MTPPETDFAPQVEALYSPQRRADRLIASGRVFLAVSSLFAVWLDPSEPANQAAIAYGLLIAYVVYALVVALAVWRVEVRVRGWRQVAHAFDLAFFAAFVYFTAGPASPFTAYFVFSLVCSALMWGWRGTLWTAIAALTAYFGIGLWLGVVADSPAGSEPGVELNRVIIRGVYLVVMAVLLGYLGSYGRRTLRELSALAATPQRVPRDHRELAGEVLTYAREVLAAPRAAIVWQPFDDDEGGGWRAHLEGSDVTFEEVRDGGSSLVADDLVDRAFLALRFAAPVPRVMVKRDGHLDPRRGISLPPATVAWLRPATLLSVPIRGELVGGRLFVLDRADPSSDELLLAEVVASVVALRLDHFSITARLARAAADSERVRLSRDLHDGVLQALTGIALRLEAVRRESGADGRLHGLEEVQALIVREQRDLRFFIGELRPSSTAESGPGRLEARLGDLVDRLQRQFGLDVDLAIETGVVAEALARDVYHLVREALVNAARHGGAVAARVDVLKRPGLLQLTVEDSGRGFPFSGRFTGGELAALGEGPKSLRERVEALGGELVLDASPGATRLEISLPEEARR